MAKWPDSELRALSAIDCRHDSCKVAPCLLSHHRSGAETNTNLIFATMFLSLFALFASLVGHSERQVDTANLAMQSLRDTFAAEASIPFFFNKPRVWAGQESALAQLMRHAGGIQELPGVQASLASDALRIAMPIPMMFEEPYARVRVEQAVLLRRLSDIVVQNLGVLDLSIVLHFVHDISNSGSEGAYKAAFQRLKALSRELAHFGAPLDLVHFSTQRGAENMLEIVLVPTGT